MPQPVNRRPVVLDCDPVKREMVVIRPRGECIDLPPYKDKEGRWRTKTLFLETFDVSMWEYYTPLFTLGEFDYPMTASKTGWYDRYAPDPQVPERHPIPSLRRIYLSYNDPSEYKFAIDVFKSTYHWKHLCKCKWFVPYLEEWRETLGEKLRQIGMEVLTGVAQGSDPKLAMQAAKWLAEQGWKERKAKGRPSDQAVEQEVKREADIERIYREDAARLGVEIQAEGPGETVSGMPGTGSDSSH